MKGRRCQRTNGYWDHSDNISAGKGEELFDQLLWYDRLNLAQSLVSCRNANLSQLPVRPSEPCLEI
jgi:hypothetical protein